MASKLYSHLHAARTAREDHDTPASFLEGYFLATGSLREVWDPVSGVIGVLVTCERQPTGVHSASPPSSDFKSILDAASTEYTKMTGKELDHPLATEVQRGDSVYAILAILQGQAEAFQ